MLQQFARYQQQADASSSSDSGHTVTYPMLYQVSKDGRTHHILGWLHCLPLDVMPEWVKNILAASKVLLSESFLQLSEDTYTCLHNNQGHKLLKHLKDQRGQFEEAIRPILVSLGIESSIDNLDPAFLVRLFLTRFGSGPRIDEACIEKFKQDEKPIVHLNDPDIEVHSWLKESQQSEQSMLGYWQNMAKIMKRQLRGPRTDARTQELIERFLTEDIANDEVALPSAQLALLCSQNAAWSDKFQSAHIDGHDGLFLGCGYLHLLGPQGILANLKAHGFSVKRQWCYTDLLEKTRCLSLS